MAHLFSSGSLPATVLASLVSTWKASEPARDPSGLGWHLTGSSWPATTRSVEQAGVPTGWFSTWVSSERASSQGASVAGTVPLDDSKPTWSTVAEIMEPHKITLNLKLDVSEMSARLKELSKKFAYTMGEAIMGATRAFSNLGKSMVPLGKFRFPVSVGFDVGGERGSKSIVASSQVSYAPVIHETFSKLSMDEYVAKHLRRFR